jgi:type VI secretion system lysozyme-like protein
MQIQRHKHTLVRGVIAPLFDRLTDQEPNILEEEPTTYVLTIQGLQASIQRELELLLNTRPTTREETQEEAGQDPYTPLPMAFGLNEFSWFETVHQFSFSKIARKIEQVITHFEPRLKNVNVMIIGKDPSTLSLQIHIEAELNIPHYYERVHFPLILYGLFRR